VESSSSRLVLADPFNPALRSNPYPLYDLLREAAPVYRSGPGAWVLTRYSDCLTVLRDPRFSHDITKLSGVPTEAALEMSTSPLYRFTAKMMLFRDPPDHTRLRTLVGQAFTKSAVAGLRARIQDLVDRLLDDRMGAGAMDVIADIAQPLPTSVIVDMMGIPAEDSRQLHRWTRELAPMIDPVVAPEAVDGVTAAAFAFVEYFVNLIESRRHSPGDDLLSAMIQAEQHGDRLSTWELMVNAVMLFFAGHETTMNLIGNGLFALLTHPDQAARLRAEPALIDTAVEELLRFDGPVHLTMRVPLEDVEIGGRTVLKGDEVIALVAAANRDPARFEDPDRLDIGRADNPHLAFSQGIHYCLGAPLGRLEASIALNALMQRLPGLELAETPLWHDTVTIRGLRSLKVRF
jgi:pimeloyl-[acyl-carrier protein] synthase